MSVQELGQLHQRYISLSNRFKASWTFHQFLQGMHKLLMDGEFGQSSADFQAIYGLLKEVSQNLGASTTDRVRSELEMAERRLAELNRVLLQEDSRLQPSLLRMFFQRVRNYNDNIVVQLVKFYLYAGRLVEWTQDHKDKVDFLVTRVAEEAQGPQGPWVLRSRTQVRETFEGLWQLVDGREAADEAQVNDHVAQITAFRQQMGRTETFDQLLEDRLIQQYRQYKVELGRLFFHPQVLMAVVETNIELRNHIQQLYRREEQRIVADYQRIFELEQQVTVDSQLDGELSVFREEVESFEKSLQNDTLSLQELSRIREHVRTLMPRLTGMREGEELFAPSAEDLGVPPAEPEHAAPRASAESRLAGWEEAMLDGYRRALVAGLEGVDAVTDPKAATLSPELFSYRLEPREVNAYRRLVAGGHEAQEVEDFILWAASLRGRIGEESEEIRGILDDTSVTRDAPVFVRARETLRISDVFLRRFDHELERAVLARRVELAADLQMLRMRLVREHSGLWLQVYRQ